MITEKTFIDKTKAGGWEEEIICEQRDFLGVKKKKKDFQTKILHGGCKVRAEN